MAKPLWLTLNPTAGSGNGTITNTAPEHTGRLARTGQVTVTGDGVSEPRVYTVTQEAKAEFASFDGGGVLSVAKTGGTVQITGLSNSQRLTFLWTDGGGGATVSEGYTAGDVPSANGADITGDPGAEAQYAFTVEATVPANDTLAEVGRTLTLTTSDGQTVTLTVTQAAGDAVLTLDPEEVTIPQAGGDVSVQVTSNTTWSVS